MTTLPPDDITLIVFEHLVRADDTDGIWPRMVYDDHAAKAPFVMAGVCQRWRELALATSTLWTYFGFPPAENLDDRHLDRLELLLLRAGNAPLDVVFGWHAQHWATACGNISSCTILKKLLRMHLRWRNVVLHVSRGWGLDFRCLEWPLLEQLSLATTDIPNMLPAAPRLRRFWLDCDNSLVDNPFAVGGYPALRMFSLFCDSPSFLRSFPLAFGQHLTELVLIDDYWFVEEQAKSIGIRYNLPALCYLIIDDGRWLQHINSPTLVKLTFTCLHINNITTETLHRFDHVTQLGLCDEFTAGNLVNLSSLVNVTTISCYCPAALAVALPGSRDFYRLVSGTLHDLGRLEPPIWPHLECLHFAAFAPGVEHTRPAVDAQDLVDFVATRNAQAAHLGAATMARIREVIVGYPDAPGWLEAKLRSLVLASPAACDTNLATET